MQRELYTACNDPPCFRFGEYCLDETRGALLFDGSSVALRPKSYEVLSYLVRHAGHLVSRDEILDAVWQDAAVSENSIGQCISEIRRALNDVDHALIKTVPRRGIIFDSHVERVPCPAQPADDSRSRQPASTRWAGAAAAIAVVMVAFTFFAELNDAGIGGAEVPPRDSYDTAALPQAFRDEETRKLESQPASGAAFDTYLRGLIYLRRIENGGDDLSAEQAVNLLQASVDADPDWAPSRAALGRALHFRASGSNYSEDDAAVLFEESRRHLIAALKLDPEHGPAYASLAFVNMSRDHDFAAADRNYRLAAHYGFPGHWGRALFYRNTGEIDKSIAHFRQAVPMYPQSKTLRWQFAEALLCGGLFEESERNFKSIASLSDLSPIQAPLAYIAAKTGDKREARRLLDEFYEKQGGQPRQPATIALLGQREAAEAALAALEAEARWYPLNHLRATQALGEPLRSLHYIEAAAGADPDLLRRIQCPEALGSIAQEPRYRNLIESSIYYPSWNLVAEN